MITQDQMDLALSNVALAALLYYPEVHVDEPGYELTADIDRCIEPLGSLDEADATPIRDIIGRTIVDPTAHREALFGALLELLPSGEAEQ